MFQENLRQIMLFHLNANLQVIRKTSISCSWQTDGGSQIKKVHLRNIIND